MVETSAGQRSFVSFGTVLDANKGFGPGFDFMRVFLAVSVLGWHSVQVSQGTLAAAQNTPFWFVDYSILPMFFGLSGFLVAGSGQRLSTKNFLVNRGLLSRRLRWRWPFRPLSSGRYSPRCR
jgi:peptidoglycan/LPS O-acetylase OafA/YrhL